MRSWPSIALFVVLSGCPGCPSDPATPPEADTDTDADADTDSDADADTDSDSDADTDADSDADTDADSDADTDADSDADTDADSDADTDADSDADTDADSDADSDADTDTDPDSDSDADTAVDTGFDTAQPCILTGAASAPIDPDPVGADTWRTIGWAAVRLPALGTVTLQTSGPVEVTDAAGNPVSSVVAPTTVYVRATEPGTGTLDASGACSGTLQLIDRLRDDLVGRPHPDVPISPVDTVPPGDDVLFALDPRDWPDVTGPVDVWLVDSRDRAQWATASALVDVRGAPSPYTPGTDLQSSTVLFPVVAPATAPRAVDVVVDLNGNGHLDPGEPIDGLDGPGALLLPDLSEPGPYAVSTSDSAVTFDTTRRVWWPTAPIPDLDPLPVVSISHGVGHEYTWYDDLGAHLASHGAVVFAHRNQTVAGPQTAADTTLMNLDAFFDELPTAHPALVGRSDASRIFSIGHSRGGEGVLRLIRMLDDGLATLATPGAQIIGASAIAPTVFLAPHTETGPGDRPLHLLVGSADSDVTSDVAPGPAFVDPRHFMWFRHLLSAADHRSTYVHGAAHDHFNCCGGDTGQSISAPVLTRPTVLAHSRAVHTALFYALTSETPVVAEVLERSPADVPLTPGVEGMRTVSRSGALVIEDFQAEPLPEVASTGAEVRWTTSDLVEAPLDDADFSLDWDPLDPMNGATQSDADGNDAERGVVFGFDSDASWEVDLPTPTDLSTFDDLIVDVAQGTRHPDTLQLAGPLSLTVVLIDSQGIEAALPTPGYADIPTPYARDEGWINAFQSVRIPLVDFLATQPDFDRSQVQTVRLAFGPSFGSDRGRVLLQRIVVH